MKRKFGLLVLLLLVGLLTACSSSDDKKNKDNAGESIGTEEVSTEFTGTIKEINGNMAIVNAKIGGGEMDVFVNISLNKDVTFEVGNEIKVEHGGTILESHPAQINTISVELVK